MCKRSSWHCNGVCVRVYHNVLWSTGVQVKPPVEMRGDMVKAELSDTEGLGFKLEERQKDIMQLKTALKMKVNFLSSPSLYSSLL